MKNSEKLYAHRRALLGDATAQQGASLLLVLDTSTQRWLGSADPVTLNAAGEALSLDEAISLLRTDSTIGISGCLPPGLVRRLWGRAQDIADLSGTVLSARRGKDPLEVAILSRAAEITRAAYTGLELAVSQTQRQLARSLEDSFVALGAAGAAYDPSVASAEEATAVWSLPSPSRKITSTEITVVDAAAEVLGYRADCSVTFQRDSTAEYLQVVDMLRSAEAVVVDAIRTGERRCAVLAEKVDTFLRARGHAPLPHALGHGVGLELHEYPFISRASRHVLEPGDVFMIEPAVYDWAGQGARVESMYRIGESGDLICMLDASSLSLTMSGATHEI